MRKLLLFIALIIVAVSSCKKYEEGPRVSLASKKSRVANTWKYDEILINNQPQNLSTNDINARLELTKDGAATYTYGGGVSRGSWEFSDDKEDLTITLVSTLGFFSSQDIRKYRILRLKNDEMWAEYIGSNGNVFEYRLVSAD
jgi:hypothetical protein